VDEGSASDATTPQPPLRKQVAMSCSFSSRKCVSQKKKATTEAGKPAAKFLASTLNEVTFAK